MAEKQHGAFTLWQARAVGFTPAAVRHRLSSGRWQELADGVYRLCGAPYTWEQRVIALTFAAGPDAAASHRSSAGLLGIPGFDRKGWPEVTTPRARRHRAPGTVVHRWRPFPEQHLTVVEGIVTTRVARTLIDLAGVLHPARTERAVDNCLAAGVLTLETLHATFGDLAGRGRKGVAAMRAILDVRTADYVAPASELEALFVALLRAAGLPEPLRQVDAGGADGWVGRIDFGYPAASLLIELDGRRHHSSLLDRRADESRDASLLAAGWRHVVRFTWSDIVNRPDAVIARLRLLLGDVAA
ncbi:MAG TPA: type IV toxin-antitoxin system AbiEi family antitoxin domain-containing protein [Acidimicrobiales bacterium]|nr:type IV toxin-antitoxin system AbiEi family antitoxin domain-containing protein [Acidimicrobiales bacterium]